MSGPYDVFTVMGQSNCYTGEPINLLIDVSGGRTFQWGQFGGGHNNTILEGKEPLEHLGQNVDDPDATPRIGFAVAFSRDYYVPNRLRAGRDVLLVPCAVGGTGYPDWDPGQSLYETAVTRSNAAMASDAGNVFKGILWHQGEENIDNFPLTAAEYRTHFGDMVSDFRPRVTGATNCPVVVGGLMPAIVAVDVDWQRIDNAIRSLPAHVSRCAFADPATAPELTGDIHFNAASQRLFAARYYGAYLEASGTVFAVKWSS